MLRQQGESTGEKYIAQVLRVADDGVQASVYDDSRPHIGLAVFYSPMLCEQVERGKDENASQQQHNHTCSTQVRIISLREKLSEDDQGNCHR